MTSKTNKIFLFASLAALLLIPVSGMVNASSEVELPADVKQKIKDKVPEHAQAHVEEIFKLAKEKQNAGDNPSEIKRIDGLMKAEKAKMNNSMNDNKRTNPDNAKLRHVQTLIENDQSIPQSFTMVTKNTLTVVFELGLENQGYEELVANMVKNPNLDVVVGYGTVEYKEYGCSARDAVCDPLQGGLRIEDSNGNGCTLGLPVKQGSDEGYLTAGHCFGQEDIYQDEDWYGWNQIGTINSGDDIDNNNCDCAFITEDNNRTNNSEIWMESWYSTDIDGTEVPNDNDTMTISGVTNDWWYETVEDNDFTDPNGLDLILLTTGTADNGDSGAPVYDWANDNLVGTLKGDINITIGGQTTTYLAVIPWASISNSSTGLGVSLL